MITLEELTSLISNNLIKLVGGILIILIGIILSRFISKLIYKLLKKSKVNSFFQKKMGLNLPAEEFMTTVIRYLLYLLSIIYALNQVGVTTFVLKFVLIFIFILIILLILLSLKDIIPNLIAGLFLHQKKLIEVGDQISVKDIKGKVLEITGTETKLETKNKDIIIVPNRVLIKNEVVKEKK